MDVEDLIGYHYVLLVPVHPLPEEFVEIPALPGATAGPLEGRRFRIGDNPIVFADTSEGGEEGVYHVSGAVYVTP